MTNPTDHELNLMLARVVDIAIEKGKHNDDDVWFVVDDYPEYGWDEYTVWSPLHDANQMERVEEAIVKKYFHVTYRIYDTESVCRINNWAWHKAENKKRAFALAVYAMEQSQKGTT